MDTETTPVEFSHSENITEIAAALVKVQGEVKNAVKGNENSHFRSRYADLTAVIEASREALVKNGVAVIQSPGRHGADVSLTTLLMHTSGQWLKGYCWVPPAKLDAQGFGSVTSYLRRYTLAAMVGIASEDDDGESAVGRGRSGTAVPAKDAPKITAGEAHLLIEAIGAAGVSLDRVCKSYGVASLVDLTTAQAAEVYAKLEKKKEEAA